MITMGLMSEWKAFGVFAVAYLGMDAAAMLAYKGYKTVKENKQIKRKHPMSYLLSIERELGVRGQNSTRLVENYK